MHAFWIFLALLAPEFGSAAPSMEPFEIYLYGEKPGLGKPFVLPEGKAVRLHLARDGFATIAVRFPEDKPSLVPLEDISLEGAKFIGGKVEVKAYALGVQSIVKSSFSEKAPAVAEVADLVVPNEWLRQPKFHIPAKRVPSRAQYLFELHAPTDAAAGDFQTKLRFERKGRIFELPIQLRIHKFALPKHFHLKTSFGFAPYAALMKQFGKWTDKELEIHDAYLRIAIEHHVDLHKFYVKFPKSGQDLLSANDKTSFFQLWARIRSPELAPYGFSASMTDLPVSDVEKSQPTASFWKALQSSVISHDMLDHSFVYFADEPKTSAFPKIKEELKTIRGWAPQLSFLGTVTYRKELEGAFNLWCPNLVQWDKPGFARPAEYLERREKHEEHFWVYTSCSAHGCGPASDESIADLVTDRPSAYHRAFAWSAFTAKAEGILYYNTVEGYHEGELAPWPDPFLFHGNGEGNLFYPCTEKICGIDGIHIVPSLRWKSIRDGLEDVEILEAGERAGLPVREWAKTAMRSVRDFSHSTAEFEKVKVRVLEALDKALP